MCFRPQNKNIELLYLEPQLIGSSTAGALCSSGSVRFDGGPISMALEAELVVAVEAGLRSICQVLTSSAE